MTTESSQHCTGPQSLQTHLVYTWQQPLKPVRLAEESGGWEAAVSATPSGRWCIEDRRS